MNRKRRWLVWGFSILAVGLVTAGVLRALSARHATQSAVADLASQKVEALVELAQTDLVRAQVRELAQGLPVSGSLKALNTAFVKARVAGELMELAVREGDTVRAGQIVARVDTTESQARLRQAREQADAAKAQIDTAQRQWDNNKALVDQGFISRTALDTSLNTLAAAQASHRAALAAVDLAQKSLDDAVLKAPMGGIVAQRLAQPGERVAVDARLIEIVDLSRLELEAALSASDSVDVRVGQTASLTVEGSATPVGARVARINPSAQSGSRSVLAYLALDGTGGLRQGLFAQGTLGTRRTQALSVPLSAVRTDKPAPYVQVVVGSRVAHVRVEPGARGDVSGETWVAAAGVTEGALVMRASVGAVREGTLVKMTAPAAPAAPASSGARLPAAPPASAASRP